MDHFEVRLAAQYLGVSFQGNKQTRMKWSSSLTSPELLPVQMTFTVVPHSCKADIENPIPKKLLTQVNFTKETCDPHQGNFRIHYVDFLDIVMWFTKKFRQKSFNKCVQLYLSFPVYLLRWTKSISFHVILYSLWQLPLKEWPQHKGFIYIYNTQSFPLIVLFTFQILILHIFYLISLLDLFLQSGSLQDRYLEQLKFFWKCKLFRTEVMWPNEGS